MPLALDTCHSLTRADETSFRMVVPALTVFTFTAPSKESCELFYRDALDALQAFKNSAADPPNNSNATSPRPN